MFIHVHLGHAPESSFSVISEAGDETLVSTAAFLGGILATLKASNWVVVQAAARLYGGASTEKRPASSCVQLQIL